MDARNALTSGVQHSPSAWALLHNALSCSGSVNIVLHNPRVGAFESQHARAAVLVWHAYCARTASNSTLWYATSAESYIFPLDLLSAAVRFCNPLALRTELCMVIIYTRMRCAGALGHHAKQIGGQTAAVVTRHCNRWGWLRGR